jgi:hypothetical protein
MGLFDTNQFGILVGILVAALLVLLFAVRDDLKSDLRRLRRCLSGAEMGAESFKSYATSYTSGANQRFSQENTDPTLGRQFYPYNMEIEAEQRLLGRQVSQYEHLTSRMESPVILAGDNIRSPMVSDELQMITDMIATKGGEVGLKPLDTGDKTAEFLMNN